MIAPPNRARKDATGAAGRTSFFYFAALNGPKVNRLAVAMRLAWRPRLCAAAVAALLISATNVGAEPVAASPADAPAADGLAVFVTEAARRFGISETWIRAVIRIESDGQIRATSPKGAMGLMQLMPQTWAALRARYGLGPDPFDPHDNILAGAAYLRELSDRYGPAGFLAAYNAGPERWEDHLATGRPLPAETRAYLARLAPIIGRDAVRLAAIVRSWTEASLFPMRPESPPTGFQPAPDAPFPRSPNDARTLVGPTLASSSGGLFVPLAGAERPR